MRTHVTCVHSFGQMSEFGNHSVVRPLTRPILSLALGYVPQTSFPINISDTSLEGREKGVVVGRYFNIWWKRKTAWVKLTP